MTVQSTNNRFFRTATRRYAMAGAAFGLLFPVAAILISILAAQLPLSLASVIAVHQTQPLLWIVDTAPLFLGLFAAFAGRREDALRQANAQLHDLSVRLKEQAEGESRRLEERTAQLQASADVGRAAVSILDTNQLLREIVNLITDRFGFYYAAVFLADNTNKWAVLREATGDAGRTLKERQHQLEIGGQSMVGSVMKTRKARIALDVGDEAVRFANPLLPDTRSEIALPLMVGSRVIGALDVQSIQMAAFDEASAAVLQSMADQIAIALSNTMQFQQAQAGLQRTRQLYEASTAISNAKDAPDILHELMTKAVLDADAAQVLTYGPRDEAGRPGYVEVAAAWGRDREPAWPVGARLTLDQVPPVPELASEPYLIRDAADEDIAPHQQALIQTLGMRALLGYALIAGSQPVGLLLITYREPRSLMAAETQPLQALTGQVAVTLRIQQLVRDEAAAVKQLDEINRRLTNQAWNEYAQTAGAVTHKEDAGPTAHTSSELGPTVLSAPIMIHGEEVGMLRLEDADPKREWTPNELALAQAVAGEVSIALENARLIEETEKRAQRERTINRITSRIRNAPTIDQMLAVAAQELRAETRAVRSIAEITPETKEQAGNGQPTHHVSSREDAQP
jgi:GAF domain-containing protein